MIGGAIFSALFSACLAFGKDLSDDDNSRLVDLSWKASQNVVVAEGDADRYEGHPTTVSCGDGRVIAVWCSPHGGWCGHGAETADGGRTWSRIDDRFPDAFARHENCPSIYRLQGPDGRFRLWVFSQAKIASVAEPEPGVEPYRAFDGAEWMPRLMSEDEGQTWREMPALGSRFRCVMSFSSIVRLGDGSYLGMFHRGRKGVDAHPLEVLQSVSRDGGFSWSDPKVVAAVEDRDPCEPCVFRSPDGRELCCLMRDNSRKGNSLVMFSRDDGATWSKPVESSVGLCGDRHVARVLKDGRILVAFRDSKRGSKTYGHYVAWIGPYASLRDGSDKSSVRLKLLHNHQGIDCGYSGVEELPDGTILSVTYLKYRDDDKKHSVVAKRFDVPAKIPVETGDLILDPETTEVVLAPDAPKTVLFALAELTNALQAVWGRIPPVVRAPTDGRKAIVLGDTPWSRAVGLDPTLLPRDAFIVDAMPKAVFLVGKDDPSVDMPQQVAEKKNSGMFECATVNAVYDFLERFAGVRYYFPGPLGTIFPARTGIRLPLVGFVSAPDFKVRYYSDHALGAWYDDLGGLTPSQAANLTHRRLRMRTEKIPCCHGQYKGKFVFRFGASHPEYFRMDRDGNRPAVDTERAPFAANAQLCQTSGIWNELYLDAKSYFSGEGPEKRGMITRGNPAKSGWGLQAAGGRYYDVMPQDGFRECFCADCQAAYDKETDPVNYATELVWEKTVALAKRLTDAGIDGTVTQMAYVPYRAVPKVDIPANVAVMVAETGPWSLNNATVFERDRNEVRAWGRKVGGRVWLWNYAGKYACLGLDMPDIPIGTPRATGAYYKQMADDIFGAYFESKTDRFLYHYLDFYVFSKVAWDNTTDVDALLAEHDRLLFGPAAKPMREFFDALEDRWMKDVTGASVATALGPIAFPPPEGELYSRVYSPEFMARLARLLDSAASLVASDSLEARRIDLFRREYYQPLADRAAECRQAMSIRQECELRRFSSGSANFVANASFANGLDKWSPLGKEAGGEAVGEGHGPAGSRVLTLSAHDETPTEPPFLRAAVSQSVRGLKPDTRYRLSYFIKLEDVRPVRRGGGASVYLDAESPNAYPRTRIIGTSDWSARSFAFTTGKRVPKTVTIKPCLALATGTVRFAGIRLVEEPALQSRIDAVAAAGGGTVAVPAGVWRVPAVVLRSNVTLKLEEGSVLLAGTNACDYASTAGRAFIWAEGATNVTLCGKGTVDGAGDSFPFGSLVAREQPRLVHLKDCRDVTVDGVTLRNGRRWSCYLDNCDGVRVRGVKIRSLDQKCCDGIDLACRNATVEACDIETHDDAIVIKAPFASSVVENVRVRNCRLASNCAYIKIGSETRGCIRNVSVRDCMCGPTSRSHEDRASWPEFADCQVRKSSVAYAGISLGILDGGCLENVTIGNVDLGSTAMVPVFLRFGDRNPPEAGVPVFRNVLIEDVHGAASSSIGCSITGLPNRRIEDVVLRNVGLKMPAAGAVRANVPECAQSGQYVGIFGGRMPAWGFYLRHSDGVRFENVDLIPEGETERPCFKADDCKDVIMPKTKKQGDMR